jgi:hypothetical protein
MTMASHIVDVPLHLACHLPGYREKVFRLDDLPLQPVARELTAALLSRLKPRGAIASVSAAETSATALRQFVRWLAAHRPVENLGELDVATLDRFFREQAQWSTEYSIKALLRAVESAQPGHLQVGTARLAHRRGRSKPRPTSTPVGSISDSTANRLTAACKASIQGLEARLQDGHRMTGAGELSPAGMPSEADLLRWLENHGPATRGQAATHFGLSANAMNKWLQFHTRGWLPLQHMLFPRQDDLVAFVLLFGLKSALSPECVTDIRVDSINRIGQDRVRVHWIKNRAMGREAETFLAKGQWSPGQLLLRAVNATAMTRRFAPTERADRLWLGLAPQRHGSFIDDVKPSYWGDSLARWIQRHEVLDDDGELLALDRRQLRTTGLKKLERRYGGSIQLAAGVNQSAQVAADHYLAADGETDSISSVIEATQDQIVARSKRSHALVLNEADIRRLREAAASTLTDNETGRLPAQVLPMLDDRASDVLAAKCLDFFDSPHAPSGEPCPAAVWECMLCKLALIVPDHLPNILRMLDHIEAQYACLTTTEWQRRYADVYEAIRVRLSWRDAGSSGGFGDLAVGVA